MPEEQNLNISLTFEQIYQVICPDCRDKFLEMAASQGLKQVQEGAKKNLLESLRKSMKPGDK